MAGKKISQLTAETPVRTDVIAQQDSVGANDARKSTIAEVLQLVETTDITDLPATLANYLDKATFTDGTDILLSKLSQGGATANQVLAWSGTAWAPTDTEIDPTGHTAGQILQSDGTDFLPSDLVSVLNNPVINPNCAIVQRQSNPATLTTYNDGTYAADRWVALFQDANGQFAQITGGQQRYAGQYKKTASGTTRLGAVQWIEGQNCYHLRNQTVTLQMRVRCSESTKTIRCGLIESTKTEDTITRDPISDWTTTPVTLIADYSFSGTPGSVVSDTNWQTLTYTTTLGGAFNNLGVLVWSETGLSQNATLDIEAVKLTVSDYPTLFVPRSIADELALCQRYYQEMPVGTGISLLGHRVSTNSVRVNSIPFVNEMRDTPAISDTSPTWVASNPGAGDNKIGFYNDTSPGWTTFGGTSITLFVADSSPRHLTFRAVAVGGSYSGSSGDVGIFVLGGTVRFFANAEL